MKTVIDNSTGKVLYTTIVEPQLIDGQTILDDSPKSPFLIPYYNFETKEFYEGATAEEIAEYQNEISQQKKEIANELLKETDWYVIRFQETGKPIPKDILDLRKQIRDNA